MNREELEYKIKLQANALKEKDEMLSNRYSVITHLSKENTNLKQALNEIREYINNKRIGEEYFGNEPYMFETKYGKDILQIIEKILGDEK